MVPGIFLCGPVENMLGPVNCDRKLVLHGNFTYPLMSYYKMCCGSCLITEYSIAVYFCTRLMCAHYQSLVFCELYYRSWFVRLSFYLLATVLSVTLPFTASEFLFGIFNFVLSKYYISTWGERTPIMPT